MTVGGMGFIPERLLMMMMMIDLDHGYEQYIKENTNTVMKILQIKGVYRIIQAKYNNDNKKTTIIIKGAWYE